MHNCTYNTYISILHAREMKDAALGNAKDPAEGTKGRAMPCVGTSGYWSYFIPIGAKDGATDIDT